MEKRNSSKKYLWLVVAAGLLAGSYVIDLPSIFKDDAKTEQQSQTRVVINETTEVEFASLEKAKDLISQRDSYVENLTLFDLQSKLTSESKTKEEYMKLAKENVQEWTESEKSELSSYISAIDSKMDKLEIKVTLPENVYFVKSDCLEEGGAAGYTREDFIVLNPDYLSQELVAHEIFHTISRYNPEKSEKIYATLGFEKVNGLSIPNELRERMISNPDTPRLNFAIDVDHDGTTKKGILVIHSDRPYEGGSFFEYLNVGFYFYGQPQDFDPSRDVVAQQEVENFYDQVGRNTDYTIHPEETSADHFTLAMTKDYSDIPNPELVDKLVEILAEQ